MNVAPKKPVDVENTPARDLAQEVSVTENDRVILTTDPEFEFAPLADSKIKVAAEFSVNFKDPNEDPAGLRVEDDATEVTVFID